MPVELRYETIVVEDGKLKIYRDVYERGTNTEQNLRRVLSAYGVSLDSLPADQSKKIFDALDAMNRNAAGQPIVSETRTKTGDVRTDSKDNAANKAASAKDTKNNGSVTRGVKGKKEAVFEIAALAGKGYPAPMKNGQMTTKKKG